ncbi:WbuC family cupin fold metalloprotein [bacterium]|nr:WbuC family cupin fold metalloprotein [bacterium]
MSKFQKHAVKALIFNSTGQVLLQKRDIKQNLPYPGYWNFFGGMVEKKENYKTALKRELKEELSFQVKNLSHEAFSWIWFNDWLPTINHFFPIYINDKKLINSFRLKEGDKMRWFAIDDLYQIKMVPSIFQNINKIISFLDYQKINFEKKLIIDSLEMNLMKKYNLTKKNNRVFYLKDSLSLVSYQVIMIIKEIAKVRKIPICRICIHKNDNEIIHEMIMIHSVKTSVGPLRQKKQSISYHIINGKLKLSQCDRKGKILNSYILDNNHLDNTQKYISIRMKANLFRKVQSLSDDTVFLEIANGPFKDKDTEWL